MILEKQLSLAERFRSSIESSTPPVGKLEQSKVLQEILETLSPVDFAELAGLSDYKKLNQKHYREITVREVLRVARKLNCGFDSAAKQTDSVISNFKMCLACVSQVGGGCGLDRCSLAVWQPDQFYDQLKGEEVSFVNSFFLAKLFAITKKVVRTQLEEEFLVSVKPKWTANLSVPDTFIETSPIARVFKEVLRTSWLMSEVFEEYPDLSEKKAIYECYRAARDFALESLEVLDDEEFGCSLYPEVGAEVASIVMSRISDEGLYAFVDIGAGTIDASIFRYFRDGSKANRPPYAAAVSKELGATQIELLANKAQGANQRYSVAELKQVKEVYNGLADVERKDFAEQFQLVKKIASRLGPMIENFLIEVFRRARDKDPTMVNQRLMLILGGGGSQLKTYRNAAIKAFTMKSRHEPIDPYVTILRKPNDFQMGALPAAEFHRFAVAYGLAFPIEELPKPFLTKDVLPIVLPKKREKNHGAMYEK